MHTAHTNRLTLLGEAFQRRQPTRFGIKRADRHQPLYSLGKTGMGKSTLLANIAIADIQAGEGLAVIDPHGALVEEILDYIPDERVDEVIYCNATDAVRPVPFNPLAPTHSAYHALVASGIIAMMKKVWGDSWGARLEHVLRYTLLHCFIVLARPSSTYPGCSSMVTGASAWSRSCRTRIYKPSGATNLERFLPRFGTKQ